MTFVYKICIWQGGEGIQQLTNGDQVPMEARESVIFLPKIKENLDPIKWNLEVNSDLVCIKASLFGPEGCTPKMS